MRTPDEYFYISWDAVVALLRQLRAASVCAFFLLSHLLLVYREGANGAVLLLWCMDAVCVCAFAEQLTRSTTVRIRRVM